MAEQKPKTALDAILAANGAGHMRNVLATFAGDVIIAELAALAAHHMARANLAEVDRAHGEAAARGKSLEARRDRAQAALDKADNAQRQALADEIMARTADDRAAAVERKQAAARAADTPRAEVRTATSHLAETRQEVARLRGIVDALADLAGERPPTPWLDAILRSVQP